MQIQVAATMLLKNSDFFSFYFLKIVYSLTDIDLFEQQQQNVIHFRDWKVESRLLKVQLPQTLLKPAQTQATLN